MGSETRSLELQKGDALILVDVQNDFLPGGSLAVPQGDAVIGPLNRLIDLFTRRDLPVLATRDWHPPGHCSFREQGGPWPPHCVADTRGADFAAALALPASATIVSKAASVAKDAYSGFDGTELDELLQASGVRRLFIGGLATDYCVLNSVRDALAKGYGVRLLTDAIRPVEVEAGGGERAVAEMERLGAVPITSTQVTD